MYFHNMKYIQTLLSRIQLEQSKPTRLLIIFEYLKTHTNRYSYHARFRCFLGQIRFRSNLFSWEPERLLATNIVETTVNTYSVVKIHSKSFFVDPRTALDHADSFAGLCSSDNKENMTHHALMHCCTTWVVWFRTNINLIYVHNMLYFIYSVNKFDFNLFLTTLYTLYMILN